MRAKPWKISALIPSPFPAPAEGQATTVAPQQVTDSFDLLRIAFGHNAPLHLQSGRANARALRGIVK